ncbi:helix-turn-helix domain-containing protein [Streptomyces rectiverticillatus]|uniref:helix-turn-helix domain-containing protein n=1 Tax=Streptomyces rectiverticillatus TaxID=173860 RepID=UPI0015C3B2DE|nr:helix-turn-helix transcriptional regulator [Streptomyces rectiverticillatus]QLE72255.1 helix-turn-helix domain-containing protein [Streptomyces rectiverticillatus]
MTERERDERLTPRQVLGAMLQHLRKREGLSLRDLADETRFGHTYIHRAENGCQLPSDGLAAALDQRFDMGGTLVEFLEMAREGSAQEYGRKAAEREGRAERIQVFTSSTIPALLQTEDYARALLRTSRPKAPEDHFEAAVTARMSRKQVFNREDRPPYWAVIDEASLRRPVGGSTTMARQLAHILKAAENPDITLQALPFERGEYWMLGGSLTLLTAPNGSTLAYVESFGSGELVESPKRVVELSQRFDTVRGLALPERESLELIRRYMEEYQ